MDYVKHYTGKTWNEWTKDPMHVIVGGIDGLQTHFFQMKQFWTSFKYDTCKTYNDCFSVTVYKLSPNPLIKFILWKYPKDINISNIDLTKYEKIYCKNAVAIMWFVDKDNMKQSQIRLGEILKHKELKNLPLNIVAASWKKPLLDDISITDNDIETIMCIDTNNKSITIIVQYLIRNNYKFNIPDDIIDIISKYAIMMIQRKYVITNCNPDRFEYSHDKFGNEAASGDNGIFLWWENVFKEIAKQKNKQKDDCLLQ